RLSGSRPSENFSWGCWLATNRLNKNSSNCLKRLGSAWMSLLRQPSRRQSARRSIRTEWLRQPTSGATRPMPNWNGDGRGKQTERRRHQIATKPYTRSMRLQSMAVKARLITQIARLVARSLEHDLGSQNCRQQTQRATKHWTSQRSWKSAHALQRSSLSI